MVIRDEHSMTFVDFIKNGQIDDYTIKFTIDQELSHQGYILFIFITIPTMVVVYYKNNPRRYVHIFYKKWPNR